MTFECIDLRLSLAHDPKWEVMIAALRANPVLSGTIPIRFKSTRKMRKLLISLIKNPRYRGPRRLSL